MNREIYFHNPGILIKRLPDLLFKEIKVSIEKSNYAGKFQALKKIRNTLVGHNENSYNFKVDDNFRNFLTEYTVEYCQHFRLSNIVNLNVDRAWINFQNRYEFNPSHIHNGIFSWVLWIKIPYRLEDEDQHYNCKNSKVKLNSRFWFTYNMLHGKQAEHVLDIDKNYEGSMIMFPSELSHGVYPFYTSSEQRISMAGNILGQLET